MPNCQRRFVVLQIGARMGYAVPLLLARLGMLNFFVTDAYSGDYLSRVFSAFPAKFLPPVFRRLLGRVIPPDIPRSRIKSIPFATLLARAFGRGPEEPLVNFALRQSFSGSNAVYTMTTADYRFICVARDRGMFVVHEQFMSPDYWRIVHAERQAFPGVEEAILPESIEQFEQDHLRQWKASDRILVPSRYVESACLALGADPGKLRLVPYGLPEQWATVPSNPKPRRVICVGAVNLAKGSHYFARAIRELSARGVVIEAIAIGSGHEKATQADSLKGPTYVGAVPRAEMVQYYSSADILVHPTLSDSFGLVQLEALTYGVPVITTRRSADLVRHGREGLIVSPGNHRELADAIESIVTNRPFRDQLSSNALIRAKEFGWNQYEQALAAALA